MENKKRLWIDATNYSNDEMDKYLSEAFNYGYDGVLVNDSNISEIDKFPTNIEVFIKVNEKNKEAIKKIITDHKNRKFTVLLADDNEELNKFFNKVQKGIYMNIKDKETMNKSIELSNKYSPIIIEFESVTNIPLELILAYSQKNKSVICKKIFNEEDGWIATMTMEMGSQAVLLNTKNMASISKLKDKLENSMLSTMEVKKLKVLEIKHVGMGDRVCIDTVSKLDKDEGMLIGSTSKGGILVSSETHYLPYMDLRPFRVNAGAIHSYVLCPENKTKYLSELKAGDEVLVVNSAGRTRAVAVGRIKMEKRPLLMIKARSAEGDEVNTIVQDDWHIRIISEKGEVKNSVLLKENDIVLGYTMKSGRHLGVAIDETITEK